MTDYYYWLCHLHRWYLSIWISRSVP